MKAKLQLVGDHVCMAAHLLQLRYLKAGLGAHISPKGPPAAGNAHSARISLTDEAACLGEGKGGAGGGRCQHCSPPAAAAGPQDGAASVRQPPGRRVRHVLLCWPGDIWQCHLLDAVSLRPHSGSTLKFYKNQHNWPPGVLGLRAFLGKC